MVSALDLIVDGVVAAVLVGATISLITDNTTGVAGTKNNTGIVGMLLPLLPAFLILAIVLLFVQSIRHNKSRY